MAVWIKIESSTPDKPELRFISRACNCSKAEAFLAFFRFFAWADEQTQDGQVNLVTPDDVDEIAKLPGFGHALEQVGWAQYSSLGLLIRNWDRHNGQSAKARCLASERQSKSRHLRRQRDASQ